VIENDLAIEISGEQKRHIRTADEMYEEQKKNIRTANEMGED
jgi:hypothetical protein